MTKFVRVELENGALATVPEAVAVSAGIKPLDPEEHPALDAKGRPLPPEYQAKESEPESKPAGGRSAGAPAGGDKPPAVGGSPAADTNPPAGS